MKRPAFGHILGYTALTVMLTAGAAQSLSGSNTVFTDDIVDGQVRYSDLKTGAVGSAKIADESVTSVDIKNESLTGRDIATDSLGGADIHENNLKIAGLVTEREVIDTVTNGTGEVSVPFGDPVDNQIDCPRGKLALSGGAQTDGGSTVLTSIRPNTLFGDRWHATAITLKEGDVGTLHMYIVCAKISSGVPTR